MWTLTACVAGAAIALVACDSDIRTTPDAGGEASLDASPDASARYDLACATTPLPTTAPSDITMGGVVVSYSDRATALPDLQLSFYKVIGGVENLIESVTSGADGSFDSPALPSNGQPYVGFMRTSIGARFTLYYPALPQTANASNIAVPVLSAAEFAALGIQNDVSNGALLISIEDCAGAPVTNATITVTQGGAAVGTISRVPDRADTFLVRNVPAGRTTIGGRVPGASGNVELYAHEVGVRAANGSTPSGAVTITSLRPGP